MLNKYFLIILLQVLGLHAEDWTGFRNCGSYSVRGVVRKDDSRDLVIVINEKTLSEVKFRLPILEQARLAPYLDQPVLATVSVNALDKGAKVRGNLIKVEQRLPNPADPADTGVKLITRGMCNEAKNSGPLPPSGNPSPK